jgi:predicted house-cleaning NTP pyrophosphatase (Maf/HAM1 superfamily)
LLLSGRRKEGVQRSFAVTTNVDFAELSTAEIAAYIATGMCAANPPALEGLFDAIPSLS